DRAVGRARPAAEGGRRPRAGRGPRRRARARAARRRGCGVSCAVAIGTFDGVHPGHRAVIHAAVATRLETTVVTFHPHPRTVLGNWGELLTTLERRVELLKAAGADDVVVVEFTNELASLTPEEFAERHLRSIECEVVVAGAGFRFGRQRSGDLDLLRRLGFDV